MKQSYFKAWIKAAGIRALKTLAQSAVAAIGTTATLGGVDWRLVASTAALAAVLSLLTSVAGLPEVDNGSNADTANEQEALGNVRH